MLSSQSHSRAERMRAPQKRRSKGSGPFDGKAWTHAELRALEDGLVALGAGRAADLRAQVLANASTFFATSCLGLGNHAAVHGSLYAVHGRCT